MHNRLQLTIVIVQNGTYSDKKNPLPWKQKVVDLNCDDFNLGISELAC